MCYYCTIVQIGHNNVLEYCNTCRHRCMRSNILYTYCLQSDLFPSWRKILGTPLLVEELRQNWRKFRGKMIKHWLECLYVISYVCTWYFKYLYLILQDFVEQFLLEFYICRNKLTKLCTRRRGTTNCIMLHATWWRSRVKFITCTSVLLARNTSPCYLLRWASYVGSPQSTRGFEIRFTTNFLVLFKCFTYSDAKMFTKPPPH